VGRDNPRGYRTWKGSVDVEGAKVQGLENHFDNPTAEFVHQDSGNPNHIQFHSETRGRTDPFVLELSGVTPSTRLIFHLDQAVEHDTAPPAVRPPAVIPAQVVELPFNQIKTGLLVKELPVGPFIDSITVQLINREAPMDGQFDYADADNPQPGDYYYLRVTQLDGARAWSSPIWVGGESPR
jgi:hypothetical protein